jgi:hypothetical protein
MPDELLFETSLMNNHFRLFRNRLEIEIKHAPFPSSSEVILLRNISEVKRPFGKKIEIHTNDGKNHPLNLVGKEANELQAKILENL